jgi:hypothetical protein
VKPAVILRRWCVLSRESAFFLKGEFAVSILNESCIYWWDNTKNAWLLESEPEGCDCDLELNDNPPDPATLVKDPWPTRVVLCPGPVVEGTELKLVINARFKLSGDTKMLEGTLRNAHEAIKRKRAAQ